MKYKILIFLILNISAFGSSSKGKSESNLQKRDTTGLSNTEPQPHQQDPPHECNFDNCPLGKGTCFENSCVCNIGFTTTSTDFTSCNYEQKDHTIAFFLEFFFPLGTGHFYAERILFGVIKLFLATLLCLFWCGDICNLRIRFTLNSKWDKIHMGCVLVNFLAFTIMHLVDLAGFGFNIYKDGNGIDLI